jgi:hypothetical protein
VEKANELDGQRRELFARLKKCGGDSVQETALVDEILAMGNAISNLFRDIPDVFQGHFVGGGRSQGTGAEVPRGPGGGQAA